MKSLNWITSIVNAPENIAVITLANRSMVNMILVQHGGFRPCITLDVVKIDEFALRRSSCDVNSLTSLIHSYLKVTCLSAKSCQLRSERFLSFKIVYPMKLQLIAFFEHVH